MGDTRRRSRGGGSVLKPPIWTLSVVLICGYSNRRLLWEQLEDLAALAVVGT